MAYVFREILPIKNAKNLDADRVGEIVAALPKGEENETLVKEAKASSHYLHGSFDWNNATAGHSWRLQQARAIIRCVEWVPDDKPSAPPVPAFVSITTGSSGGSRQRFTPLEIFDSEALQLRLMRSARTDLIAWLNRYRTLRSISPLIETAVERIDAQIAAAVAEVTNPDAA